MRPIPQPANSSPLTWREVGAATAGFTALAVVYTWPLVGVFFSKTLWLGLTQALLANAAFISEQLSRGSSPLVVERVLWPAGYTIHEGFLPSLVVAALGGGLAAVNLNIVAGFTLTGLGAYLLSREVTPSRAAAFLGGACFSFSPQHFANGGSYPIFPFQWLAFFAFALLAYRRTGAARWALLAAVSFGAACLSSWYFGVFSAVVAGVFLFCFARQPGQVRRSVVIALALAGTALLLLPFSPLVLLGSSGLATGGPGLVVDGSADLLSFLLPSGFHWVWGTRVYAWQSEWLGDLSLQSNGIGLIALALVVYGLLSGATRTRTGLFLLLTAALCWLLALGPFLAVGGLGEWAPGQPLENISAIPLPYYWLMDVFPFSATRATARYAIVTNLMLAALAAGGAGALAARLSSARSRRILTGALLIGLLAEVWPVWPLVPDRPLPRNPFYDRLAEEPGEESVLELPFRNNGYRVLFNSAGHSLPVIGGAVDKPFARFAARIDGYPLLRQLRRLGPPRYPGSHRDITQRGPADFFGQVVAELGIRHAIVHKWNQNLMSFGDFREPEPFFEPVVELLRPWFDVEYEDGDLLVLRPRDVPSDWLFSVIAEGFGDVEDHGSYLQRVVLGTRGRLEIHSSTARQVDLLFRMAVILTPSRQAAFTVNGEVVKTLDLPERSADGEFAAVTIPGVDLETGINIVEISTPTPARSLAEVYGGTDHRPIAFLVNEIRVRPAEQP